MAELSGIYGADPFANMTPEEFLKMAQGQGLGEVPLSTEFPGLGSDFSDIGGIDSFFEDRAKGAYKGIDPSVLANQAEVGNALAAAELANREGEFGGFGLPLDSATDSALELPEIDMSGLDVEYQMEQAAKKKAQGEAAEAFRANEAKLAGSQGGLNSMSISESQAVTQAQADEGFLAAMDDFFESARGAGPEMPEKRTIEEYKRVFSEATGIDTSGKVDKKDALMAFGLALMQNKAGKGFNVGKMLQSVGEAGDKAMPALQRAKERARQGALAGGKYALEMESADTAKRAAAREKAMDRGKYWVYKKGAEGSEFEGFDQGQFVDLNKYELNKLIMDPNFEKQFDFVNGSDRMAILEKRAEGVDLGDQWDSYERVSLIGGKADDVPPELQVLAAPAASNYKGITPTSFKLAETPETIAQRFIEYQDSINSGAKKFEVLIANLNEGISVPKQILGGMKQTLRNFGIAAGDMPSTVSDAKRMLNNLAIDEATNILKESGKTLSDTDRQLVKDRIGKISWTSGDVELIKKQLDEIYDLTVLKPQRNLDRAVGWLEQNAGIKFGGNVSDVPNQAELDAMNKTYGTNYTLDDFK